MSPLRDNPTCSLSNDIFENNNGSSICLWRQIMSHGNGSGRPKTAIMKKTTTFVGKTVSSGIGVKFIPALSLSARVHARTRSLTCTVLWWASRVTTTATGDPINQLIFVYFTSFYANHVCTIELFCYQLCAPLKHIRRCSCHLPPPSTSTSSRATKDLVSVRVNYRPGLSSLQAPTLADRPSAQAASHAEWRSNAKVLPKFRNHGECGLLANTTWIRATTG